MEWKSGARIIIVCGTVGYLWQFAVTCSGPGTILVRSVAGVLGGVGFVLWLESELKRAYSFSPFTVRIETNRAALVDHGLATAEQLDELDESLTDLEGERRALVNGIASTVLSPGFWPGHNKLIRWNDSQGFSTELKGSVDFTELSAPDRILGGRVSSELWVREGENGLDIGVDT